MKPNLFLFCLVLTIAAFPTYAGDAEDPEGLYDQHCIACHGPDIYTREDRKVNSLPALERQVQRCELALGLRWFDEEIAGVTNHLNESFYHFKP